jgi:NTE family protein
MNLDNKSISLVLGSGGARGLAHIGVIQVLEEHGYNIRSISGSSMGALIGGIYAAGELETYREWICSLGTLDVLRLLDLSFSGSSLFKGEKIIETLRELIGPREIEDLPLAFTAVATDLDANKEVWISNGSLFEAIRASIAFPTVFSAVNYRGRTLVDGGLLNPIPIAPTLRDTTAMTIAVNLNGRSKQTSIPIEKIEVGPERNAYHQKILDFIDSLQSRNNHDKDDDSGFIDIVSKSIDAMQSTISRLKLATYSPDLLIEIPKNACTIYEFDRARELIEIGRCEAEQALKLMKTDDFERSFSQADS